jgi:HEAT repeats
MAVTMEDVRAALDPEEPNYDRVAKLGAGALPHLEALVNSGDTMLASKAAYAASLIRSPKSAEIVVTAAHSDEPAVRVAAAAGASNLSASGASDVLVNLVGDSDPGVRKVARASVPDKAPAELAEKLEELGDADQMPEPSGGLEGDASITGSMPGETDDVASGGGQTMPGEKAGRMPGEQQEMPGG